MDNFKKIQAIDLETFKKFKIVCESHNLRYIALGGTMLGAVRHNGFIPWDDDIDIGMPRKDYELFINKIYKELPDNYQIRNYKTDINYRYYITRILDLRHPIVETRNKNIEANTYVSIDIFPLDGLPSNYLVRKFHEFKIMLHRAKMSLAYFNTIDQNRKRNNGEKFLISILTRIPVYKIFNPQKEKGKIDKLLQKYDFDKSSYFCNLMGAYRTKEVFPKSYYGKIKEYDFENTKINGVEKYDSYLKDMYGDYMSIPNSEEIDNKLHFELMK